MPAGGALSFSTMPDGYSSQRWRFALLGGMGVWLVTDTYTYHGITADLLFIEGEMLHYGLRYRLAGGPLGSKNTTFLISAGPILVHGIEDHNDGTLGGGGVISFGFGAIPPYGWTSLEARAAAFDGGVLFMVNLTLKIDLGLFLDGAIRYATGDLNYTPERLEPAD